MTNDIKDNNNYFCGGDIKENTNRACAIDADVDSRCVEPTTDISAEEIQNEIRKMERYYQKLKLKTNVLNVPRRLQPGKVTWDDLAQFWMFRKAPTRLSPSTVTNYIRAGRRMASHEAPFDARNPVLNQWQNHADVREVRGATKEAMKHEWRVVKASLEAYGIPFGSGTSWVYSLPDNVEYHITMPAPPMEIHELTVYKHYSKNPYHNAMIQLMLRLNYYIGWRVPSEPFALRYGDFSFDRGLVFLREQKKDGKPRPLKLPPTLLTSPKRMSVKKFMEKYRPMIEKHEPTPDEPFFLNTAGRPYASKENIRSMLRKKVVPVHLKIRKELSLKEWDDPRFIYAPNKSRAFVATGLLIHEIRTTGHWNKGAVKRRLGHDIRTHTMETYTNYAEILIDDYDYDWIGCVLDAKKVEPWRKQHK